MDHFSHTKTLRSVEPKTRKMKENHEARKYSSSVCHDVNMQQDVYTVSAGIVNNTMRGE